MTRTADSIPDRVPPRAEASASGIWLRAAAELLLAATAVAVVLVFWLLVLPRLLAWAGGR